MNKVVSSLLFVALLVSCGGGHNTITLKGKFKHLREGQFYLFSSDPAWGSLDTLKVNEGSFQFSHILDDTLLLIIQYPNFMQMQVVGIPGQTVTIKGDANNLLTTRISGGEDNELLTDFRLSVIKKSEAEVKKMAEDFIREHPASFASQAILLQYFIKVKEIDAAKTAELIKLMRQKAPERASLRELSNRFLPLAKVRKGQKLPHFQTVTLKGEKIDNKTLEGSFALVSFWSLWDSEMMSLARQLHTMTLPYKDKLKVVNISLDADTSLVLKQVERDSIPGYQICDAQAWQSPMVRTFGVHYLPANILVSPKGVILWRDMDISEIADELKKSIQP